jgi:hypothetical protein
MGLLSDWCATELDRLVAELELLDTKPSIRALQITKIHTSHSLEEVVEPPEIECFLPPPETVDNDLATSATAWDGWAYVYNNLPQIDKDTGFLVSKRTLVFSAGQVALAFVVYSSRMILIPLWTLEPHIPMLCPIYAEGILKMLLNLRVFPGT